MTSALLEKVGNLDFGVNATNKNPIPGSTIAKMEATREILWALETKTPLLFRGSPGNGKTSFTMWILERLGFEVVYIPAPTTSPEALIYPGIAVHDGERTIDFILWEKMLSPNPKVIVIDEPSRATVAVRNQLLELVFKGTLGDRKVPNLQGVIACDNASAEDGLTMFMDFALADRFLTVEVDSRSFPWQHALAAKFPDVDLTDVFEYHARLTPHMRKLLSPRTLEHVIWNALEGLPLIWGLPMPRGKRALLIEQGSDSHDSKDRTEEILGRIASMLGARNPDSVANQFDRAVEAALKAGNGTAVYLEGPPGFAKTSRAEQLAHESGCNVLALSIPTVSPENLVFPELAVGEDGDARIRVILTKFFMEPGEKVLVLDEIWRGSPATSNVIMEIVQEKSLGGVKLEGLRAIIALNNPRELAGYRLDAGSADRAQADRFHSSVELVATSIPWDDFLLRKFHEHQLQAEAVIQWWKEDLDPAQRNLITARTAERLIERAIHNMPLRPALPHVQGEYVEVALYSLETRLAEQIVPNLTYITKHLDKFLNDMADGDLHAITTVQSAFIHAAPVQLEEHYDAVVQLFLRLSEDWKLRLVNSGENRNFWINVLMADPE